MSRSTCSEGGFGLWLGGKGIVNGKTSTIFHILISSSLPPIVILLILDSSQPLSTRLENLIVRLG
jgi:hypothetical protein